MLTPVVLIPLDGSPQAEYALPQAEAAARSLGHSLRLLGIVDPTPPQGTPAPPPALNFPVLQQRVELEEYLHRLARSLQQRGVMTEVLVLCEPPGRALAEAVAAPEVVLTVMAKSEEGGAHAIDVERVVLEAAAGAVLVVQPQLQPV